MKSLIAVVGLLAVVSATTEAATITLARGIGNSGIIAQEANGTSLSTGGYYIAVGTFTNALGATEIPVITTEFSSLLSAIALFDTFGSGTSPISGTTIGTLATAVTALGGADPSIFNTKEIFVLVGNKATAGASDAWGIFRMTTPVFFPANVAAAGGPTLTTANASSITPLTNAGSVIDNATGADGFRLVAAVPEPSAALLGALGVLGLLRRRRI